MGKKNTVRTVDMELITDDMFAVCASCHKSIVPKVGVCIGRPSFTAPAMNVCLECVTLAAGLMLTTPPFGLKPLAQDKGPARPDLPDQDLSGLTGAEVAKYRKTQKGKRS